MKNNLFKFFLSKLKTPSEIKIALPEKDDRVNQAVNILTDIGLKVVNPNSSSPSNKYMESLKRLKFSKNWPEENLTEYLNNPFIKSLVMLRNNQIDGVVCGCTTSSAEVIRNAIRIIGLKKSTNWLSSMFLMVNAKANIFFSF